MSFAVRSTEARDAATIWAAAGADPALDGNSWYAYWLLCTRHFSTCAVAYDEGRMVGFVTGLLDDARPGTLFVWQLWVSPQDRRQRVAHALLAHVRATTGVNVTAVEATIDPANTASLRTFASWAKDTSGTFNQRRELASTDFPPGHGAEDLIQVRWIESSTRHTSPS